MSEIICPQCQATIKEGAKFCHVCGYKVPEEQPQKEAPHAAKEEQIGMRTFTDVKSDEVFSAITNGNIFKRAINIMFKPKTEWEAVAKETPKIPMLILGYALIFSIIPILALIIKDSFYGGWGYGFQFHFSFIGTIYGFFHGFLFMIAALTAIIVSALIINSLAPAFKTEKNLGRAMQLTTYSFTPMFFATALYIIPYMSFMVSLVGLYGIFLVLMGQPIVMKTPKNTQIGYFFTSIGIMYGIFFSVFWISSTILTFIFRGIYGYYLW